MENKSSLFMSPTMLYEIWLTQDISMSKENMQNIKYIAMEKEHLLNKPIVKFALLIDEKIKYIKFKLKKLKWK